MDVRTDAHRSLCALKAAAIQAQRIGFGFAAMFTSFLLLAMARRLAPSIRKPRRQLCCPGFYMV
jgi:hypothetical protein